MFRKKSAMVLKGQPIKIINPALSRLDVLNFFNFILQRPLKTKKMPYNLPLKKIFQFCSKLFNESVRAFLCLVQAVLKWAIGRTRSGLTDSLKNFEKN